MTLAHRTPDAGSAKVGCGALRVGIQVTAKKPREPSASLSLLSSLSFGPSAMYFRAAFDLPQPDEKRTVAAIKRRLPLLLTC